MAKILISWMAFENDFLKGKGIINPDGPSSIIHKCFYNYDYHLLLSSSKNETDDTRFQHLINYLHNTYKNKIIGKALGINDVINLEEISGKINSLLINNKEHEMDIFISTGTPTMQVAWYLAHESLGIKTSLFQLRKPEHSKTGKYEQVWVKMEKSSYTSSLIIKQESLNQMTGYEDKLILNSLEGIYRKAEKIAAADHVSVFINGETGTGKELLAKYIHDNSPRAKENFIAINCSALNDQLLESRLFGHIKGAFTGAIQNTIGLLQEGNGGTVFLDEIGDISPYLQQSLLRIFPKGEILRVGSRKAEYVNVRIISATNKDLPEMCKEGKFRDDLYYRLTVSEIKLPPLRDYKTDEKEQMFEYFWNKGKIKYNKPIPRLESKIKKLILEYSFPGNIRELENLIEGIIAESESEVKIENLPQRIIKPRTENSLKLVDVEREHVNKVYKMFNQNMSKTAKVLGISVNTLKAKI